ncbi:hypothetical protein QJS04_geneDACA006765 [Acorus gramineus]|uniref:CYTH domain-containing protein n=1 Tax=Acorus gramineus TaxID=55184 RepID=A0AAV9AVS0_ACOGR|nr:hypothetical protein QJS04_geneDACA006765 [Acorus gramineus]
MAQNTSSTESPGRMPDLLRDQVHLIKRADCDRYKINSIQDSLSFEKGSFVVIHACQLLAQKNDGIVLVGIAGPSGAGKTAFTEKVLNFMPNVVVISMDNYTDASRLIDGNFDDPRLIDYDMLLGNIQGLKEGKSVQVPIYDFKSSSRTGYRAVDVPSSQVVIVEGIYALSERLRPLLDLRVSVSSGVHFDLVKRVLRDIQRAGQEPEEIIYQISETVYPMYKAFIEPDLQTAHIKIINKFNPFSGFQNRTYILKSSRTLTADQIKAVISKQHKESTEETCDIYLLPPGEEPEACQSHLRMRNRDGKYHLMFEEWITERPFIISTRITFKVSVRLLGGLMALGYTIAAILKRSSHVFSDDMVTVKIDWLEQLNRHYVQVQGRDRLMVKNVAGKLGLEGSYIPRPYIEQIQMEKLVSESMALPDDLKTKLSIYDNMVLSPKEALFQASSDRVSMRTKHLKGGMSQSYSNLRDKSVAKLIRLTIGDIRFDGRIANQGIIQLGEQLSTLNERMDEFTSHIEELNLNIGNSALTGPMLTNSSSATDMASPLTEEIMEIVRSQRWMMHQLDNLCNLLHENSREQTRERNRILDYTNLLANPLTIALMLGVTSIVLFKRLYQN